MDASNGNSRLEKLNEIQVRWPLEQTISMVSVQELER
jgi:hypothetical protein